ncbi:MAG: hypothetical protein A2V70_13985 [Planctomycetes bacterium RBG_13_63_9]|nr:MAG: hypothetical protein A2V70_13985 [Planctomycetes bacterium RBG_13_63_9]
MFGASFYGDQGTLVMNGTGYKVYERKDKLVEENPGRAGNAPHTESFLDGIRKGTALNAEIETGYKSMRLCHLGSVVAHPLAAWVAYLAHYATLFVPPAIATIILCRLATRSGRGWPWLVAASTLVALLALCYYSSLIMPTAPGTGRYTIGLGFSTQPFHFPQVLQMAVPLGIGALFLCRLSQRRRLAPSA